MRIAIDARAISWTGIATYVKNLLAQYARLPHEHHFTVLVPAPFQTQVRHLISAGPKRFTIVPVDGSHYSWREQTVFLRQLLALDVDLVHFTHFNVPLAYTRPYIVTIHDATRFIFPGQRQQSLLKQMMYEVVFTRALKHARQAIFVTKHTQQEINALGLPRVPSTVIYEGVSDQFFEPVSQLDRQKVRSLIGIQQPYLLYVGVWMSHKNIRRILESFRELHTSQPELRLVITGKPVPGYTNALQYAQELGIVDLVVFPGYVSQELLPALYGEAACFVFPSLYEGFGLPPLEAAACGTPVVTSNVSSLPEVMGEAASYVNPEDTSSITTGVRGVLDNSGLRTRLIESGKNQAALFSWEAAAQSHLRIYEGERP